MKVLKTPLDGLLVIKQSNYKDNRGSLRETSNHKIINNKVFKYEYSSMSKKNVMRGFHFQTRFQQIKFVNVLKGKILDCVVDLRKRSKTFGKTFTTVLSQKNCKSLYIPEGFGHSYLGLSNESIVYYKMSDYFKPNFYSGIVYNDRDLNVKWPKFKPIISDKDKKLSTFKEFCKKYNGL